MYLKKVNLSIFLIIVVLISITSCKLNGSGTKSHFGDYTLYNYKWESAAFSDADNVLSLRKDLTCKDGVVYADVNSGKGDGTRSNFFCGNLGMTNPANGINLDFIMNENTQSAGVQIFDPKTRGAQFFWVYLTRYGDFGITRKAINPETSQPAEKGYFWRKGTGLDATVNKVHNIKFYTDDNGNMKVYLDNNLECVIKRDDIMFSPGNFFIVYQTINGQEYTSSNAAKVCFMLRDQEVRK